MSSTAASFILPDFFSHCNFDLRISPHRKQISAETKEWFFKGEPLVGKTYDKYNGIDCGLITAACYPGAAYPQLRVCCDFFTYFFLLDDICDDMDKSGTKAIGDVIMNSLYYPDHLQSTRIGKLTRDYWKRFISTASPGTQRRFIETLDFFLQSVMEQAGDRQEDVIPDLESYIALRRDTSGTKTCFVLIEYAYNLNIPDTVMDHPLIRSLAEATDDFVAWSNDIFSYNVEQAKGDTHNMVAVVMCHNSVDVQSAVDFVSQLCKQSIDRFNNDRANLPSWGPEIDRQVQIYVNGLADWIIGSLHWSYESERYFGKDTGRDANKLKVINLLPKQSE